MTTEASYQCISCGVHFPLMLDYYRHRRTSGCLTAPQMFAEGIRTCAPRGALDANRLLSAPRVRQRATLPAPRADHERLAEWLLEHGVSPARAVRAGVREGAVLKAIKSRASD